VDEGGFDRNIGRALFSILDKHSRFSVGHGQCHHIAVFNTPEKSFEHSQATIDTYYYFKSEFILFATACEIMTLLLAIRLVVSMWQYGPKAMNH
jgi:hypothetical protein